MSKLLRDQAGNLYPAIVGKLGTSQVLTAGATSSQSTAFGQETTLVRVAVSNINGSGAHVHIAVGTNPTATTSSTFIPGGSTQFFAVSPSDKIAVLRGGGTSIDVSITEITNA